MMQAQQRDSFGCRIHGDGNKKGMETLRSKTKKEKKKRIRF